MNPGINIPLIINYFFVVYGSIQFTIINTITQHSVHIISASSRLGVMSCSHVRIIDENNNIVANILTMSFI